MNAKQLLEKARVAYNGYNNTHAAVMVAFKKLGFEHANGTFEERRVKFMRWVAPSHQYFASSEFDGLTKTEYGHVIVDEILRSTEPELAMWRQFIIDLEQIEKEQQDDELVLAFIKHARNMIYCRLEYHVRDALVERINTRILKDAKEIIDRGDVVLAISTDLIVYTGQPYDVNARSCKHEAISAIVTLVNAFFVCDGGKHSAVGVRNVNKYSKSHQYARKKSIQMINDGLK